MAAYGPQGIPRGQPGSPGWPRRSSGALNADPAGFPAKIFLVRTDQVVKLPDWCTAVRMGATGAGGDGIQAGTSAPASGGGGGGFAGTNQLKVANGTINVRFDPVLGTIVEAFGYTLIGGKGAAAPNGSTGGAGGVGSGGDVNFNGGAGASSVASGSPGGGGGAAGRGGNGSAGTVSLGGQGAPGVGYLSGSAGGGAANTNAAGAAGAAVASVGPLIVVGLAGSTGQDTSQGGDGGGGGGGNQRTTSVRTGGAGFALIECW
jgi:hypothetical protein